MMQYMRETCIVPVLKVNNIAVISRMWVTLKNDLMQKKVLKWTGRKSWTGRKNRRGEERKDERKKGRKKK